MCGPVCQSHCSDSVGEQLAVTVSVLVKRLAFGYIRWLLCVGCHLCWVSASHDKDITCVWMKPDTDVQVYLSSHVHTSNTAM